MNKFIKEQLQKANVIIKYPDGTLVDLDNVTNCEFIIEQMKSTRTNPQDLWTKEVPQSDDNKPQWPEIILRRNNRR